MAILPVSSTADHLHRQGILGRAMLIFLIVLIVLFGLCLAFSWSSGDSMASLLFFTGQGKTRNSANNQKTLVDLRPWQTAEALAALAVTAEETAYAHESEHLADHEVDQAFASALRIANTQAQQSSPKSSVDSHSSG